MFKLLLLPPLLLLSACTSKSSPDYWEFMGDGVNDKHIEVAKQMCSYDGGYNTVDTTGNQYYPNTKTYQSMVYVKCNNGAKISKRVKWRNHE